MSTSILTHPDRFVNRHIGPSEDDRLNMIKRMGVASLDVLIDETIPRSIRLDRPLALSAALSETELLRLAAEISEGNKVNRSLIGTGYYDCITPPVILRNILQNPGWYTQYTPYQAEISQGRLEALLNYQTMVSDLVALPIANASLLDEATAAAEAMHLAHAYRGETSNVFFVASDCHPQTIEVVRTRAEALGHEVWVGDADKADFSAKKVFGALVQYPSTTGLVRDFRAFGEKVQAAGGLFIMATDLLAMTRLVPPGELGADIALGSAQRFGVPLGYGGPHAAFFATKQDFVRKMPGRIIGVSKDVKGKRALRMALQTREQHIRREKATSNICTAQALLAIVSSMYAVYHGPKGIRAIGDCVHARACVLAEGIKSTRFRVLTTAFFDTLAIQGDKNEITRAYEECLRRGVNLRRIDDTTLGASVDETTDVRVIEIVLAAFGCTTPITELERRATSPLAKNTKHARTSEYLTHPVWSSVRSETEMLRYIKKLEGRDLSLTHAMIPLGSCTMKLNATAEMMPITDPAWNRIHPYAPRDQAKGYARIVSELESALGEITGLTGVSLQPNAGSQGEYAGLLVVRKYHESRGEIHRRICLIPSSAHGTNPASAVMAGLEVVVVACDSSGNVDLGDLAAKAKEHSKNLAAIMLTYPSTHGVFEEDVKRISEIVHEFGGQVYMDGANMNAQVGLTRPSNIGADVCHLNLHKTFCIPHGGGGPGMGPICVAPHLAKFLPRGPVLGTGDAEGVGAVSAAPWGSASILLISWAYIRMMGPDGLLDATKIAILNANYIASRLAEHFPVVYRGTRGRVAHECILDVRPFKKTAGIEVDDIAKRLIDYGFHAPTMSFPIPGTLMVEPTESEPLAEIDRFCDAMIAIRSEIRDIEEGRLPQNDNPLKNAPHTLETATKTEWNHPYPRELAAFPSRATRENKFFPFVSRVDNAFGDRNLVCSCPPIEDYA